MNRKEPEQNPAADAGLDEILAQMAEEVPPMPADFHDRWMNAVRAEARKEEPAAEGGEAPEERRAVSAVRWTRVLSTAAVFVFLIGGTLIHRNAKKSLSLAAMPADYSSLGAEAAAGSGDDPADSYVQAAEEAEEEALAGEAGETFALKTNGFVQNASVPDREEEAAYEAAEADYAAEAAYEAPAATAAPTLLPTAAPTETPSAAPEPTPEETPVPEPEESGFLREAGTFFADMGDFLLAALPYLLVLAVPAAVALVMRRKKGKTGGR